MSQLATFSIVSADDIRGLKFSENLVTKSHFQLVLSVETMDYVMLWILFLIDYRFTDS